MYSLDLELHDLWLIKKHLHFGKVVFLLSKGRSYPYLYYYYLLYIVHM